MVAPYVNMPVHYYIKGMPQAGYLSQGAVVDPEAWSNPQAATITKVISPTLVNVMVFGESGGSYPMVSVQFIEEPTKARAKSDRYCTPVVTQ